MILLYNLEYFAKKDLIFIDNTYYETINLNQIVSISKLNPDIINYHIITMSNNQTYHITHESYSNLINACSSIKEQTKESTIIDKNNDKLQTLDSLPLKGSLYVNCVKCNRVEDYLEKDEIPNEFGWHFHENNWYCKCCFIDL